ncbi:MAG: cation:proton antiporter, partial [Verrucomicrobiae bacterium]|nr:cation:proton antiporter [Verrucomicrobiae bacterium]
MAGIAGWICQRIGLSVVVGYLVAGILIGPHTPPFQLVGSVERVQMLAEFGLVFLIFSIGMGLSLGRLQRLGVSVALATPIGA